MARKNPVRGQYVLQGLDLIRAGIFDVFRREDSKDALPSAFPAEERWLTSRAVSSAAGKAGIPINLAIVPAAEVLRFIQQDPRAKVRTTEEHIVHMLGGDSPENRAYAQAEVARLIAEYNKAAGVKAA